MSIFILVYIVTLSIKLNNGMSQKKIRINTGKYCPQCQGLKDDRATLCKNCRAKEFTKPRICKDCNKSFPYDETKHKTCKECIAKNAREKRQTLSEDDRKAISIKRKEWRINNPRNIKRSSIVHLFRKNKLDVDSGTVDYIEKLIYSQKQCTICHTHTDECGTLHIDHDHTTGEFRGLLCGNCNVGIGMLKDSPMILAAAIDYLIKPHKG